MASGSGSGVLRIRRKNHPRGFVTDVVVTETRSSAQTQTVSGHGSTVISCYTEDEDSGRNVTCGVSFSQRSGSFRRSDAGRLGRDACRSGMLRNSCRGNVQRRTSLRMSERNRNRATDAPILHANEAPNLCPENFLVGFFVVVNESHIRRQLELIGVRNTPARTWTHRRTRGHTGTNGGGC